MPERYNPPVIDTRWHAAELGLISGAGRRNFVQRSGWRASKTDPKPYPARQYKSTIAVDAHILRQASPAIHTYGPDPLDGLIPYFGTNYAEPALVNGSWARLMDDVKGPSSSLGTTIAEGREAFTLMADRLTRTYRSYKALKRGRFKEALRLLSVDPKRKHRNVARTASKEASGLWLEYWFGWAPLCSDIFDSILTTSSPDISGWVTAYGSKSMGVPFASEHLNSYGDYRREVSFSGRVVVRQGAEFRVVNPNLFLANRLGLVNPVSIAWELVPFSFVVDWFAGVGNYIGGYSDLWGVEFRNPYTTRYVKGVIRTRSGTPPNVIDAEWRRCHKVSRGLSLSRPLLVPPKLVNFGSSKTRAATAASLMVQILIKD